MDRRRQPSDGSRSFERSYATALHARAAVARGPVACARLARRARTLGVGPLALARMHDRAEAAAPPSAAARTRGEAFFGRVVDSIDGRRGPGAAGRAARPTAEPARRSIATLRRRLADEVEVRRALGVRLRVAAREHKQLVECSRELEARLRHLSHRILSAQEEERLRISRDLHDAIGQTLTGINVGLATLKQDAAADSRELARAISLTQQLVATSMKTVHQFAWELRPALLDDLGLLPAVRSYARLFAARTGLPVSFEGDKKLQRLDADRSVALFRVAQGALSNVERHARATHATVTLHGIPGGVRLEVTDDGRAFDARAKPSTKSDKHLGLIVMRERVEMVGGRLSLVSSPGRGTKVQADVPYATGGGAF